MAKIVLDIPDKYIDFEGWARETLSQHGMSHTVVETSEDAEGDGTPEDPWSAAPSGARQTPRSAPTSTQSDSGQPATPPKTGSFIADGKKHEFGLEGAPECDHNRPCVRVSGKNQKGKPWKQWRCALSSTDRWKDKCDFSEWA